MEKLIEKAKEQNEEIERQPLLLEMDERVLLDKEKELQENFNEIAELRMTLDEEEKKRHEEVRRFQSQLKSADDHAMRLAIEKQSRTVRKGTHSFKNIIGSKFASSINNFGWHGLSTIKFTG